jgi:hypothetical protein
MKVLAEGVSTDILPSGSEVVVDFKAASLIFRPAYGDEQRFSLVNHTQKSLLAALLTAMKKGEFANHLSHANSENLIEGLYAWLAENKPKIYVKQHEVVDEAPLLLDQQTASDYADAQYQVFTGIARFRATLNGYQTPLIVWPEHFDLSTLWFVTEKPDEYAPHMNFGFAPFSPGIPQPYLYIYAYPYPDGFVPPSFPAPMHWESKAYRGVFVDYDDLAKAEDVPAFVETLCMTSYRLLRSILP